MGVVLGATGLLVGVGACSSTRSTEAEGVMLAHAGAADESLAIGMVFAALWVGWIGWSRLRGTGFGRLPAAAGPGLIGVAVVLLVASAIVPGIVFGPTPTAPVEPTGTPTGPRIASTATLAFDRPVDGASIDGDELQVVLDLRGGTVIAQTTIGRPARRGAHPSVGRRRAGVDDVRHRAGRGRPGRLEPGDHTLDAEFVAADHLPFDPPVTASTTFTTGGA